MSWIEGSENFHKMLLAKMECRDPGEAFLCEWMGPGAWQTYRETVQNLNVLLGAAGIQFLHDWMGQSNFKKWMRVWEECDRENTVQFVEWLLSVADSTLHRKQHAIDVGLPSYVTQNVDSVDSHEEFTQAENQKTLATPLVPSDDQETPDAENVKEEPVDDSQSPQEQSENCRNTDVADPNSYNSKSERAKCNVQENSGTEMVDESDIVSPSEFCLPSVGSDDVVNGLKCAECNYSTTSKQQLSRHMCKKHRIHIFSEGSDKCDTCGKKYVARNNLQKHKAQPLGCNYPHTTSARPGSYLLSNEGRKFSCVCGASLKSSWAFYKHVNVEHGQRGEKLNCDLCEHVAVTKRQLATHKSREHGKFECDKCGRKYLRSESLQKHKSHTNGCDKNPTAINTWLADITDGKYRCRCGGTANSRNGFYKHMYKIHESKHVCPVCGQQFGKYPLKLHMRRMHTDKREKAPLEKKFLCSMCGFKTAHQSSLKSHLMFLHGGEKSFHCTLCESKYYSKGDLDYHMRCHTGERPYMCGICRKSFTGKYTLRIHERSHSGEKPYACDQCSFRCSSNSGLRSHSRTHTGERPYACKFCEYKCSGSGNLKTHIKSKHTTDRPYSCHLCDYTCKLSFNLTKHRHTKHKAFFGQL